MGTVPSVTETRPTRRYMMRIVDVSKCPNCGGVLDLINGGRAAKCQYCDSEFEIERAASANESAAGKPKKEIKSAFNKPEWFDYQVDYKKLIFLATNGDEIMHLFDHCVSELGTSDAIIEYIKSEMPDDTGIYHDRHKPDKLNMFIKKAMKGQLAPDEKAIFYVNTALFSCGRSGFLITDKKIAFSAKKQPIVIYYNDLRKLDFNFGTEGLTYVHIHLNDIHPADINCIEGYSHLPYGPLAALICTFAFEQNPGREKIAICKYEGEE